MRFRDVSRRTACGLLRRGWSALALLQRLVDRPRSANSIKFCRTPHLRRPFGSTTPFRVASYNQSVRPQSLDGAQSNRYIGRPTEQRLSATWENVPSTRSLSPAMFHGCKLEPLSPASAATLAAAAVVKCPVCIYGARSGRYYCVSREERDGARLNHWASGHVTRVATDEWEMVLSRECGVIWRMKTTYVHKKSGCWLLMSLQLATHAKCIDPSDEVFRVEKSIICGT